MDGRPNPLMRALLTYTLTTGLLTRSGKLPGTRTVLIITFLGSYVQHLHNGLPYSGLHSTSPHNFATVRLTSISRLAVFS